MANNGKSKLKILYVLQILQNETDTEHGLSLRQIMERLKEFGIDSERKGIYRDIETLREFGVDIQTYQRNPVQYAIAKRDFSLNELMLLVDAVESCRFLTKKQVKTLTNNIKHLTSEPQRALLNRQIHVENRVTSKNDNVFNYIDMIHDALHRKLKIEFLYYKTGVDGECYPTNDGNTYIVTPVSIAFDNGYYYLSAWSDEHEKICEYRIDRMGKLKLTSERATKNQAISNYEATSQYAMFGHFGGDCITTTLLVDSDKVDIIRDRFGNAAEISRKNATTAKAAVKVCKSEQFFGWIAGLGGCVRIATPKSLKTEYAKYLKSLIKHLD